LAGKNSREEVIDLFLQAWWSLVENKPVAESSEEERRAGARSAVQGQVVEVGWLARKSSRPARFRLLPWPLEISTG
jgi:hypothetical protein